MYGGQRCSKCLGPLSGVDPSMPSTLGEGQGFAEVQGGPMSSSTQPSATDDIIRGLRTRKIVRPFCFDQAISLQVADFPRCHSTIMSIYILTLMATLISPDCRRLGNEIDIL